MTRVSREGRALLPRRYYNIPQVKCQKENCRSPREIKTQEDEEEEGGCWFLCVGSRRAFLVCDTWCKDWINNYTMNIYILQISLSFFLGPSTCRASITVLLALSNPDSMTTLKQSSLWSLLILINLSQLRRSLSLLFRRRQNGIRAADVIGVLEIQYPSSSPNTESQ